MLKALADRLAEAFAERLHERVRREFWGYAPDERSPTTQLIRENYRGIRPAPGYPACPDHTEKATLWQLLDAEPQTGIRADRVLRDVPGRGGERLVLLAPATRATSPSARSTRDQVEDYAARKGMTLAEAERWLAPNLGYEPGRVPAEQRRVEPALRRSAAGHATLQISSMHPAAILRRAA